MKKGCAILFLFLALSSYGQKTTLLQNINTRAKELKHSLNKTGDSLILKSDRNIDRVEIFNSNFEKSFSVSGNNAKIPLQSIPVGRFITEVKINEKYIIITLLRHKPYKELAGTLSKENLTAEIDKSVVLNNNESKGKDIDKTEKPVKFYWIEKNINKGHSSSKLMRLGDREIVEKMIEQHHIDIQTSAGRLNMLTVWEVYDTSKFMRYKRINPDFANVDNVDFFNTDPFYNSNLEE